MEFRLLGPVEVSDGESLDLGGNQRKTVLAVLLVNAGEPVSTDHLVEELWADRAPSNARRTVQAHVAHLRKILNRHGSVLERAGNGYVARIDGHDLDVREFESLVAKAHHGKDQSPADAAARLEKAIGLFRGPKWTITPAGEPTSINSQRGGP